MGLFGFLLFTATFCDICSSLLLALPRFTLAKRAAEAFSRQLETRYTTSVMQMALGDGDKFPKVTSFRDERVQSISANLVALTAALSVLPTIVTARQGAFEMDVEYYLKTVASRAQGKSDAIINAKTNKPAFASARVINKDLASSVVSVVHEEIGRITGAPVSEISAKVDAQMLLYLPYFKEFVPIKNENYSDQYYFDITLYVSYLVAAQLIPKSTDRVILRKAVGDRILDVLIQKKLVGGLETAKESDTLSTPNNLKPSTENIISATIAAEKMTVLARGVKEILSAFAAAKFVASFTVDEEDIADKIFAESSFVEGLPVNFQLTVVGPVNLLGFLETAAADTFFHPEIIATTISSYTRSLGYKAHYEDYLVDNYYLANGIDTNIVTAQDVLIEMQIATQNSDSPDF